MLSPLGLPSRQRQQAPPKYWYLYTNYMMSYVRRLESWPATQCIIVYGRALKVTGLITSGQSRFEWWGKQLKLHLHPMIFQMVTLQQVSMSEFCKYLLNAIYTSILPNFPTVMQIVLCISGTVPMFWSCKMLNLSIYLLSSMWNKFPLYSNAYSWCHSHMYYQKLTF